MKKFFIFLILCYVFFSCKRINAGEMGNEIKKESVSQYFDDTSFKSVLDNYTKHIFSNNNEYCFVYVIKDFSTNFTIKIDNFTFTNTEKNWWFIYDLTTKSIIVKELLNEMNVPGEFIENDDIFYFNLGTSSYRTILVYNLKAKKITPFNFLAIGGEIKDERADILFSNNYKYVAYLYPYIDDAGDGFDISTGIKVLDIDSGKVIIKKPSKDELSLEIIEWKSNDSELLYKEIKNRGFSTKETILDNLKIKIE